MIGPDLDLPDVDALTTGFIGEPGARTFYLQAWRAGPAHSFKVEKTQVAALGAALRELLADVVVDDPARLPDLVDPGEPEWVVGSMGVSTFDETTARVTLVLRELVIAEEGTVVAPDVDDEETEGRRARIGLTIAQMAALAERCEMSVEGGRPPCELCGRPIDPDGHVCPKTNGSARH